jgi:hypothetical protein
VVLDGQVPQGKRILSGIDAVEGVKPNPNGL